MNSPNPKKKKKMNKWLLGTIIVFAVIGTLVVYVGYKAKKGMNQLDGLMNSMTDVDIAKICLKAETDPATKQNMENLKKATPQSLEMLKKMSPGIYNYNKRQMKMCASDYKAVLAKAPASAVNPTPKPAVKPSK